jgi:hypothetical protein
VLEGALLMENVPGPVKIYCVYPVYALDTV